MKVPHSPPIPLSPSFVELPPAILHLIMHQFLVIHPLTTNNNVETNNNSRTIANFPHQPDLNYCINERSLLAVQLTFNQMQEQDEPPQITQNTRVVEMMNQRLHLSPSPTLSPIACMKQVCKHTYAIMQKVLEPSRVVVKQTKEFLQLQFREMFPMHVEVERSLLRMMLSKNDALLRKSDSAALYSCFHRIAQHLKSPPSFVPTAIQVFGTVNFAYCRKIEEYCGPTYGSSVKSKFYCGNNLLFSISVNEAFMEEKILQIKIRSQEKEADFSDGFFRGIIQDGAHLSYYDPQDLKRITKLLGVHWTPQELLCFLLVTGGCSDFKKVLDFLSAGKTMEKQKTTKDTNMTPRTTIAELFLGRDEKYEKDVGTADKILIDWNAHVDATLASQDPSVENITLRAMKSELMKYLTRNNLQRARQSINFHYTGLIGPRLFDIMFPLTIPLGGKSTFHQTNKSWLWVYRSTFKLIFRWNTNHLIDVEVTGKYTSDSHGPSQFFSVVISTQHDLVAELLEIPKNQRVSLITFNYNTGTIKNTLQVDNPLAASLGSLYCISANSMFRYLWVTGMANTHETTNVKRPPSKYGMVDFVARKYFALKNFHRSLLGEDQDADYDGELEERGVNDEAVRAGGEVGPGGEEFEYGPKDEGEWDEFEWELEDDEEEWEEEQGEEEGVGEAGEDEAGADEEGVDEERVDEERVDEGENEEGEGNVGEKRNVEQVATTIPPSKAGKKARKH